MRERLSDRRMNTSQAFEHGGGQWLICVGWDSSGKVREIFIDPLDASVKPDSDRKRELEDAMINVSHLLQSGQCLSDLAARRPRDGTPRLLGERLIAEALRLEDECGQAIRDTVKAIERARDERPD